MNQLTPAEQARFDQIDSELRDHVLEMVRLFRQTEAESGIMGAKAALTTGLILGGQIKAVSVATMAIALLAEQEPK
jgi:hypothetical protein